MSEGLSTWHRDAVTGDPNKPESSRGPGLPEAPWADVHSQACEERLRGLRRPCKWQRLTGPEKGTSRVQNAAPSRDKQGQRLALCHGQGWLFMYIFNFLVLEREEGKGGGRHRFAVPLTDALT